MQADHSKIGRLPDMIGVVKKEAKGVGGVKAVREPVFLGGFVGDEPDLGVALLEKRKDERRQSAGEPTPMFFLETHCIGEPGEGVAQRPDRELDEDIAVSRIIFVAQHLCRTIEDFDAKTDVKAFGTCDDGAAILALEENIARVEIAQSNLPLAPILAFG